MRWDTVEREVYILGALFKSLSETFQSLAGELRRERENGSLHIPRAPARTGEDDQINEASAAEPRLPFPEDPFE